MKFNSLISEVLRNFISGTSKALIFSLALTVVTLIGAVADAVNITNIKTEADAFQAAGANIKGVESEGKVDGKHCDDLSVNESVKAGAIRIAEPITLAASPSFPLQLFSVSPGFVKLLGFENLQEGVLVSQTLAETAGLAVGHTLQTSQGDMTIAGIYPWPDDGRDARIGFALLNPVDTKESFSECWLRAWPMSNEHDTMLKSVVSVDSKQKSPSIARINSSLGLNFTAYDKYGNRITKFAPLVVLLFGIVLGFISAWIRRLEYSAALHSGQQKQTQILGAIIESLLWAIASGIIGLSVLAIIVYQLDPSIANELLTITSRTILIGVAGVPLGVAVGTLFSRERYLFKYFKSR